MQLCCDWGCGTETFIEKKVIAETVLLHKNQGTILLPPRAALQPNADGCKEDVRRDSHHVTQLLGSPQKVLPGEWVPLLHPMTARVPVTRHPT